MAIREAEGSCAPPCEPWMPPVRAVDISVVGALDVVKDASDGEESSVEGWTGA